MVQAIAALLAAGACLGFSAPACAQESVAVLTEVGRPLIHGDGRWWSDGNESLRGAGADKGWSVTALRTTDDEIRGRVSLTGVPQVNAANVEARLSGRGVIGKLLDDEGQVLATFEGTVSAAGASGTFVALGGGTGSWTWDGPAKPAAGAD